MAGWTEVAEVLRVCLKELRFSPDLEVEDLNGEVCSGLTLVGTSTYGLPQSCLSSRRRGLEWLRRLRVCLEKLRSTPSLEVEDLNGSVGSGEMSLELRFSPSLEGEDLNDFVGSREVKYH